MQPGEYAQITPRPDPVPPGKLAYAGELRSLGELLAFHRSRLALIRELPHWPNKHVLVLPGFLSSDLATSPLRKVLSALGHKVEGWELGRNLGLRPGRFEELESRFFRFAGNAGEPVAVIGWSLGGLYAVELARRYPQAVRQVITMGSPVSGVLRANNAWRLYERVAGHPIDSAPVNWKPGALPAVPLIAISAQDDGIVHPQASHASPGPEVENLQVPGTHSGLCWNAHAIRIIADRLARR